MSILQEIINPNTVNLTNAQQGVLITIKLSPTPEVAYQSTNGAQQLVYARNTLRMLGLLRVGDNKTVLTDSGSQVLINYNLVDETGQLTQRGQQIMSNFNKQFNKPDDNNGQEDAMDVNAPAPQSQQPNEHQTDNFENNQS